MDTTDTSGSSIQAVSATNQLLLIRERLQAGLSSRLLELKTEMDKEFGTAFVDMESYLRMEKGTMEAWRLLAIRGVLHRARFVICLECFYVAELDEAIAKAERKESFKNQCKLLQYNLPFQVVLEPLPSKFLQHFSSFSRTSTALEAEAF